MALSETGSYVGAVVDETGRLVTAGGALLEDGAFVFGAVPSRLLPHGGGVRYPLKSPWKPYFRGPTVPVSEEEAPRIAPRPRPPVPITGIATVRGPVGVVVARGRVSWEHRNRATLALLDLLDQAEAAEQAEAVARAILRLFGQPEEDPEP